MRPGLRAAVAAVTVGALLALVSCGGSSAGDASASGPTRTVKDTLLGDVEGVPEHPKRIVALWRTGSELADLGVVPVAALEGEFLESELGPKVYQRVANVPTVGSFEGVDVEKVIAAEPDLIIGMDNGALGIDYDELKEVAPTVILKVAEPPDVWDNYPRVADLADRSTDYKKRRADLDKSLSSIAKEYGDKVGRAEVVSFTAPQGTIYVDTSKSLSWRRIDAAGFGYVKRYTEKPKRYALEVSSENIADLADADIIFYDVGLDGKPLPGTKKVLALESFERLPAVRKGNVFPLTAGTNFTFPGAERQIRDLRAAANAYQPAE